MKNSLKNPLMKCSKQRKIEVARVANNKAGICPAPNCGSEMIVLECADNISAYTCLKCRVALPVENDYVSK